MKITAFNGSHRGRESNTGLMVGDFLRGAEEGGAKTERICLTEKKISLCKGCFSCWKGAANKCVIRDDMDGLIDKFMTSDFVIFATPLYVDNVSGITKIFMDRIIPIVSPKFGRDNNGESRHVKRYGNYPKIIAMSNCGFPQQSHFQVLSLLFERIARNMHSEVVAEIYRAEGELLRCGVPFIKSIISGYRELLRKAGRELAENSEISAETEEKLQEPLVPESLYTAASNYYWGRFSRK